MWGHIEEYNLGAFAGKREICSYKDKRNTVETEENVKGPRGSTNWSKKQL